MNCHKLVIASIAFSLLGFFETKVTATPTLQWFNFEVTESVTPVEEETADKKQAATKEQIKARPQKKADLETDRDVEAADQDAVVEPKINIQRKQPENNFDDDIAKQLEIIQKRRAEDEKLEAMLKEQQEKRAAEREAQAQKHIQDESILRVLSDIQSTQNKAFAEQNNQISTLMETINAQQEQLKMQQAQLQGLSKYKDTLIIDPVASVTDHLKQPMLLPKSDAVTFEYMSGSIYRIYCRPGFDTDIQLHYDEEIINVVSGDRSSWLIKETTGGVINHVYIQPIQLGSETNLIINTNKRIYQLIVTAAKEFNPIIHWSYPANKNIASKRRQDDIPLEITSVNMLDFDYIISQRYAWRPDFVFNDGFKTYIKLSADTHRKAPAIFIKNLDNTLTLANYVMKNGNYVIDTVITEAELRVGEEIVYVKRKR